MAKRYFLHLNGRGYIYNSTDYNDVQQLLTDHFELSAKQLLDFMEGTWTLNVKCTKLLKYKNYAICFPTVSYDVRLTARDLP